MLLLEVKDHRPPHLYIDQVTHPCIDHQVMPLAPLLQQLHIPISTLPQPQLHLLHHRLLHLPPRQLVLQVIQGQMNTLHQSKSW